MSAVPIVVPPKYKSDYRSADLCRKKHYNVDFSGQDLSKLKMRQSLFYQCIFTDADMTETDCEGSEFFGSKFISTLCYRTNFKDAKLAGTVFEPKDCFGMTISLECGTFEGMKISALWYYGWLVFGTMMHPIKMPDPTDNIQERLLAAIGAQRYAKLKTLFSKRNL